MRDRCLAPLVLALLGCGLLFPRVAAGESLAVPSALRAQVERGSAEVLPALVEIRRDIHRHPELGFREQRTAALIVKRLRALGIGEIRTGLARTGVAALLRGGKPGPTIAVRADMDALPIQEANDVPYRSLVPGVKHACGHDSHVAIALGVATLLSRMRAELVGQVLFLFQPAEEGDPDGGETGAVRLIKDGALEHPAPSAIFGLHVFPTIEVGKIAYNPGPTLASSDRFTLTLVGKKTHGAYPQSGIDPLPIAAEVILALQTIPSRMVDVVQQPTVLSVGTVQGGNRFNIIADSVTLTGTVRSLAPDGPAFVRAKMEAIAKGITSSYGTTYKLVYDMIDPVTLNDRALALGSLPALEAAVGAANVVASPPQMGAEDFAHYQQHIPGFYFFLGVRNPAKHATAMIHTENFDLDEDAMRIGVRAMSMVVLDALFRGPRG